MQFDEIELDLIWRALAYSAEQHRNQRRKDGVQSPYINHPIEVAETLWRIGGVRDVITLTAALLHDTVEDTGTTEEYVRQQFGGDVSAVVMEVTDDKNLPKIERKRLQVEHATGLSMRARLVKLADKICNVHDIGHSTPPNWTLERSLEYLDWASAVVAGLRGANRDLEHTFDLEIENSRILLAEKQTSH